MKLLTLTLVIGIILSGVVHLMGIAGVSVHPLPMLYLRIVGWILGPTMIISMLLTADEVRLDEPGKPYGEAFFEEWPDWLIRFVGGLWIYAILVELFVPVSGFWLSFYVTLLAFLYVSERAVRSAEFLQHAQHYRAVSSQRESLNA